jgi:hypothetical protein
MAIYDQSHNERPRNALSSHLERPFKRAVDVVRNRVHDLTSRMHAPAFLDQYPARTVPFMFAKTFELGLVTARKLDPDEPGNEGFETFATPVNLGAFVKSRNGNIFVNREGPFYWCSSNISSYVSLSYDADPGFGGFTYTNPTPASDIFNRAIEDNGGALAVNYFFGHVDYQVRANTAFDLQLYDKKRNRFLHEEHLPPQVLTAQGFSNKHNASPIRFDPNTEIEPRVRVLEVRMGDLLDTDQAFNAAQFKAYLHLIFKGYKVLEV